MRSYQEQLKIAKAELKEALLDYCDAEAALNITAWTYFEAQEVLKTKREAVERAIPPVVLESIVTNNDYRSRKKRL